MPSKSLPDVVAKINPDLMLLAKAIGSLSLDDNNARRHGKRDRDVLMASLKEYGQQKPIVALANGKVIAGNGTLEAARELGWTHIAVVTFDNEDAARAAAFAIVDNRSAELSEWDYEALTLGLKNLPPELLNEVGFSGDELAPLLRAEWLPAPVDVLPTFGEGKHVVAFSDDQWRVIESAAAALDNGKMKPIDAILKACSMVVSQ